MEPGVLTTAVTIDTYRVDLDTSVYSGIPLFQPLEIYSHCIELMVDVFA